MTHSLTLKEGDNSEEPVGGQRLHPCVTRGHRVWRCEDHSPFQLCLNAGETP